MISLAESKVSIDDVCNILNIDTSRSGKVYCPFGPLYHSDGGVAPTMRIYDTNVYCFRCQTPWSPLALYAQVRGIELEEAAEELLVYIGYKAPDINEMWEDYIAENKSLPNTADLAQALKIYCARISLGWSLLQFEDSIASTLDDCFKLLDYVMTEEDADKWLKAAKLIMRNVIEDNS